MSLILEREIIAERRTPPTTTTSPILHIMSWHSIGFRLRPREPLNTLIVKSKRFTNGCGPEERPPIVLSLAPAGRSFVTSIVGICPDHSNARSSRYAFAHPAFESSTVITVDVFSKVSGTEGSLLIYLYSTENPTPVPHIRMYIVSSKDLGESTGTNEQLYPGTWSLSRAGPAVIRERIDGITLRLRTASFTSCRSFASGL